jgi:hypothetical protein
VHSRGRPCGRHPGHGPPRLPWRIAEKARVREIAIELLLSALLIAVVAAMALGLGASAPLDVTLAAWLVVLLAAVLQIDFDVGEGRTRPVQLVLVPMLLLLPPALVPLLVVAPTCSRASPRSWSAASRSSASCSRLPTAGSASLRRCCSP